MFFLFLIFFPGQSFTCSETESLSSSVGTQYPTLVRADLSKESREFRSKYRTIGPEESAELIKQFKSLSPDLDRNGDEFYLTKVCAVVSFKDLPGEYSILFNEIPNLSQETIKSLRLYNVETQTSSHVFG